MRKRLIEKRTAEDDAEGQVNAKGSADCMWSSRQGAFAKVLPAKWSHAAGGKA